MWRFFGRAHASPSSPTAAGICDRCNFTYQLSQLKWQYEYRGESLGNLRIRVCPICLDKPQMQLKTIVLPADPLPVQDPRPGINQFMAQENQGNSITKYDNGGAWDAGLIWDALINQ
jgi:hypothetical protein